MSGTVLAGSTPEVEQRIREAVAGWPGVVLQVLPSPLSTQATALLGALDPVVPVDVVVLGPEVGPAHSLDLTEQLAAASPHTSVVLIGHLDTDDLLAALRAGVRDVLEPDAEVDEIRPALERAGRTAFERRSAAATRVIATSPVVVEPAKVITVLSPKGGVGKTTVATNLAVGLAKAQPHTTVLVDLDVQFGDVASGLQLDPEHSVLDAMSAAAMDPMVLKTFLTPHPSGLYALCAPEHPAGADQVTGDDVATLLTELARQFRYVVVDTSAGLTEHTLGAIERTTDLLLVCGMDVPSVRAMRKELDVLDELGMATAARTVVLNCVDHRSGLTVKDIEAMLGRTVDVQLPRSREVPLSTNRGVPLLASGSRDPAAKELTKLVRRYCPSAQLADGRRTLRLLGAR